MHSPLLLLMLLSRVAHASFMTPAAARAPRIAAARCARLTAVASVDAPAPPRRKVKDIGEAAIGDTVVLKGWVRSVRGQKAFSFIDLNDGSSMNGMQVVAKAELDTYDVVGALSTGAALAVEGEVKASPAKGQTVELAATRLELVGACPAEGPDAYPLQKKRHTLEFLRTIAHLRPRTNTVANIARVRSTLAQATHAFFANEGFRYVQTPLITASDCEGAGEMFRVTTLPAEAPVPTADDGSPDYSDDFFGKPAFLTVSGQLCAETHACALGDVYTFGAAASLSAPAPRRDAPLVAPCHALLTLRLRALLVRPHLPRRGLEHPAPPRRVLCAVAAAQLRRAIRRRAIRHRDVAARSSRRQLPPPPFSLTPPPPPHRRRDDRA